MAKKAERVASSSKDDAKLMAFLAAFLSIFGFIIAYIAKKDDKYVMFYAKQSVIVFIACVIVWVISGIVGWIPVIGLAIMVVLNIITIVLWVLSWIYALSGKMKEVPIVGIYARKFKF